MVLQGYGCRDLGGFHGGSAGIRDHSRGHGRSDADLSLTTHLSARNASVVLTQKSHQRRRQQPFAHGVPGVVQLVLHHIRYRRDGTCRAKGRRGHGQPTCGVPFRNGKGIAAEQSHKVVSALHFQCLLVDALGLAMKFERSGKQTLFLQALPHTVFHGIEHKVHMGQYVLLTDTRNRHIVFQDDLVQTLFPLRYQATERGHAAVGIERLAPILGLLSLPQNEASTRRVILP